MQKKYYVFEPEPDKGDKIPSIFSKGSKIYTHNYKP